MMLNPSHGNQKNQDFPASSHLTSPVHQLLVTGSL